MHTPPKPPLPGRAAAVALAAAAALGLGACGGENVPGGEELAGGEYGADVQEVTEDGGGFYAGPYGRSFADDLPSYVGEEVVLTGDVEEVVAPGVFTIVGPEQGDVEPLLVIGGDADDELAARTGVEVTGTVGEDLAVTDLEQALGADLDDALLAPYAGERYLVADAVELLPTPAG